MKTFADVKAMLERVASHKDLCALNDAVEQRFMCDRQRLFMAPADWDEFTRMVARKASLIERQEKKEMPIADIFDTSCTAIVNPVNCEGVMGAGLALKFKQRYPAAFVEYRDACGKKLIVPGKCLLSYLGDNAGQRYAIQFPTKDRWRSPSEMGFIDDGLADLVNLVRLHAIPSIAIPALGCGLGGLDWRIVRSKIEQAFAPLDGQVEIELYDPK